MAYRRAKRPGELTFAILLVVFSVVAFWQSYLISGFSGLTSAGVMPMFASATMLLASLSILRTTLVEADPAPLREQGFREKLQAIAPPRFLWMLCVVCAYIFAMPYVGFVASSAVFLFVSFWSLWRRGPLWALGLTVVSLAAIYLIFREIFQVVLPGGTLLRGLF